MDKLSDRIAQEKKKEEFTPSPGKQVNFVDDAGKVVKTQNMNRAERRRLKIYKRR